MTFCDCWKPSTLVTNHIIMLYLMETLEFIFKMLFEAIHLNQQLKRLKQLFSPYSFQHMKWESSVHTEIVNLYFEEIFNITHVVSVLVCFQLQKNGKLYPNWFTKEMYALGPLEVGRVSQLVQSLQIHHLYTILEVVSFSGQLPSLGRGCDSPRLPNSTKWLTEKKCVSWGLGWVGVGVRMGEIYPRSKDFSFFLFFLN